MYVIISVLFATISFIITFLKMPLKEDEKKIIRILSVISLFMTLIAYPIVNRAHALIGNMVFMILISYLLEILIFREFISGRKVEKIKKITLLTILTITTIICMINNIAFIIRINSDTYYFDKESPYYGSVAEKEVVQEIDNICEYIRKENQKGNDVKIISCYSNLYMNVLNKNNGMMDLPFYGNLGKNGVEGLKSELNNLEHTKILLVEKEDYRHMQESEEIKEFIVENFERDGEIEKFSVFNSKK
ncbi:MAG: hypothetical protein J6M60_06770 [Clostridia bacterium]|nr:hypothetical protein [Clostridia bacterium]